VVDAFLRSARHQQTCNHASKQAAHQKLFNKALKLCISYAQWWHASGLKCARLRAMGRLASGPGLVNGAVAFIQMASFINQGFTSRCPGYISKATMLLVSESGASRRK
jgi:hypothetical protein